jgi:predicted transcriptional regulator
MTKSHVGLDQRIRRMLEETPGQSIIELAGKLRVNRTYLAGYLEALQEQGRIRSKRIGPAKVYFTTEGAKWLPSK